MKLNANEIVRHVLDYMPGRLRFINVDEGSINFAFIDELGYFAFGVVLADGITMEKEALNEFIRNRRAARQWYGEQFNGVRR